MRRILIISTTFFPDRVVGAVRMSQWCRHLPGFGWKPMVLCRSYGARPTPLELATHIHPEVQLRYFGGPTIESAGPHLATAAHGSQDSARSATGTATGAGTGWWQLSERHRRWRMLRRDTLGRLSVPDLTILFWRRARAQTLEAVDEFQPDVILTSSPPHSIHDVGLWLSQVRPHIPWVADYRDPHLIDPRFAPHGWHRFLYGRHESFEAAVYRQASMITHAIPVYGRWARRRYPDVRGKIKILTNGCPAELANGHLPPQGPSEGPQKICVMGARDDRQRTLLVRAAQQLVAEGLDVQLRLVGPDSPADENHRQVLGDRFVATGQLPHQEALGELVHGDALVCAVSDWHHSTYGLSSKLFEFLACGRPTIVVNATRSDQQFFKRFPGTRFLMFPTDEELAESLRWALASPGTPSIEQTISFRQEYSRQSQVGRLADWLDELVQAHEPQSSLS